MSVPRVSLMARLALTMGAISVAAVALSMTLVYHALDELAQRDRREAAGGVAVRGDRGDARRLEQVVDNLLSNALRYTDPGGRVTLHVSRGVTGCVVEVRDTGIGIASEDLPHVFDRFWRSDRSRSRATGGSGIGLAVVRELVRAHHGRVELRSELGEGTVARVVLPAGAPAIAVPVRAVPAWA